MRDYRARVRRAGVIASLILILIGLVVVMLPFSRPMPRGTHTYGGSLAELSDRCAPPIVSAWRSETASGWFGYAPLIDNPPDIRVRGIQIPLCQPTAQRRLAYAGFFWLAAAVIALALALRPVKAPTPTSTLPPEPAS